jgi:hypothetical protein
VLIDQRLLWVRQLNIPGRDDHSLARLAFLVAVRIDLLDQLTALDGFGAENTHTNSKIQKKSSPNSKIRHYN